MKVKIIATKRLALLLGLYLETWREHRRSLQCWSVPNSFARYSLINQKNTNWHWINDSTNILLRGVDLFYCLEQFLHRGQQRWVVQSVSVKWISSVSNLMVPISQRHAKFERNGGLVIQILKKSHQILEDLKRSNWKCARSKFIRNTSSFCKKDDQLSSKSHRTSAMGSPPNTYIYNYSSQLLFMASQPTTM